MKECEGLVIFEGLSGSGKTTIAKLFAEVTNSVFYTTPSTCFAEVRDIIDKQSVPEARFLFYLASVVQASSEIEELLKANKIVVCDRWVRSTIAYHQALGVQWTKVAEEIPILEPKYSFFISCNEETRQKRIEMRGLSYNDEVEKRKSLDKAIAEHYASHNHWHHIDNSPNDPMLGLNKALQLFQNR